MDRGNRERLVKITKKTKKCDRCPSHDGENRSRRVRADKYKNKRSI